MSFRTAGTCLVGHSKDVEYKELLYAVPRAFFLQELSVRTGIDESASTSVSGLQV